MTREEYQEFFLTYKSIIQKIVSIAESRAFKQINLPGATWQGVKADIESIYIRKDLITCEVFQINWLGEYARSKVLVDIKPKELWREEI